MNSYLAMLHAIGGLDDFPMELEKVPGSYLTLGHQFMAIRVNLR